MATPDLLRLLDCVAISDALDGLLVYGATGATLEFIASALTDRLTAAGHGQVDQTWLGAADTEDALWGNPGLPEGWGGRGLLVPPEGTTRVVVVPDLSRLSLAAARAGVTMLGSRSVHLERRGTSRVLRTAHRWIAAVAEEDRVAVSRHLLDRFAIRVRFVPQPAANRKRWLSAQLSGTRSSPETGRPLPADVLPDVPFAKSAFAQAIASVESSQDTGMRRPIALLHVAEALARIEGARRVNDRLVREAAALTLSTAHADDERHAEMATLPEASGCAADSEQVEPLNLEPAVVRVVSDGAEPRLGARPAQANDALLENEAELNGVPVPLATEPSSEPGVNPGAPGLLRLPWHQTRTVSAGYGTIIGTRRADNLQDLAITETLLAAAPFQPLRRKQQRGSPHVILRRGDLRSYRRAPPAGELLTIVLDYTSVARRDWLTTLVPFLADAYAMRAELCVVRVGAASAANPYRADRVMARNLLVPSVAAALEETPGRATPLADGLALAFRTIRQTLGHGRSTTRRATLIVVTDGRGNVPLKDSHEGRWTGRVGRQGIDDARQIARTLRDLAHVRRVLIDPKPDALRDLPLKLAAALGADVVAVEPAHG